MDNKIRFTTRTAILLAVALVFQLGGFPQFITGPFINTVLYIAVLVNGLWSAVIIGIFTPVIALVRGILPAPLGPMVPFIALANAVLAISFGLLKDKSQVLGIIVASVSKFLLLAAVVSFIIDVPEAIASAMTFPQLITALVGGFIALLVYKGIKASGYDLEGEKEVEDD